jgi:LmbE family N-acetylglucosaminyl deacetylase
LKTLDPAALSGARALIVAPHPDDEAFGCGGTLHLMAKAGAHVHVAVLASGQGGVTGGASPEEREDESRRGCELLGVAEPLFLRLTSAELREDPAAAGRRLADLVGDGSPDTLFVPSPLERHTTHQAALLAALCTGLERGDGADGRAWWGYGVWDAIPAVEGVVEVDVTAARSAKTMAMASHVSQNKGRSLAAGMAARDMAQASFSRITGDDPRKAVERLLDLRTLASACADAAGPAEVTARIRAWLDARQIEWTASLWPDA